MRAILAVAVVDQVFLALVPGVASRNCSAVYSSVGDVVTPVCTIRRVVSPGTTKIYYALNSQSKATVKSQAQMSGYDSL